MVEQQNIIMQQIKSQNKETKWETSDIKVNPLHKDTLDSSESQHKSKTEMQKSPDSVSFNTHSSSCVDVMEGITRNSSSSMQTLRRILEIEEMRQFSENITLRGVAQC